MINTSISKRKSLFGGVALPALALSAFAVPAYAQVAPAEAAAQETAPTEDVVVTGSLIRNPNLEASTPVNVISEKEIELQQANVAEELIRELPGAVPSIGSAVNNGNGGASFVNLRNLGSNRNVVLLDGVRIVPAELQGRFDLNNIPLALVQRVDVQTGGASTTYGADAVAGVVNFITRSDFAGMEASISNQITEEGDGNVFRADVTIGANFDSGRGNAVLSIGYQESDAVYQGARDYGLFGLASATGTGGGSGTSVPSRFLVGPGVNRQVTADGTAFVPTAAFTAFNFNPYNVYQTPFKRHNIYGAARYEISDAIEVYTRGLFSKNTVETIIAPSGAFGIAVNIPLNNPFLTTSLRNSFCNVDVNPSTTVVTARFTAAECAAAANPNLRPGDAAYREIGTGGFVAFDLNGDGTIAAGEGYNPNPQSVLSRRATEAGPRISRYDTTLFDYRLGFKGALTSTVDWDIFGSYGESDNIQTISGYTLNSRVSRVAAGEQRDDLLQRHGLRSGELLRSRRVDQPGCRGLPRPEQHRSGQDDDGSGTCPGQRRLRLLTSRWQATRSASQSAANIVAIPHSRSRIRSPRAVIWAAPAAQHRTSTAAMTSRKRSASSTSRWYRTSPFFQDLSLEAGVRYSSYKIATPRAPTFDTTTWKVGGSWTPVEGVKIRGNYARAVRAPNIAELFNPLNTGLTNISDDPCATLNDSGTRVRANPSGTLRAVCIAQGATAGSVDSIPQPTAGQGNSTSGGNPNLSPEKSTSWTVGAVVQPIRGVSLSVDYFNIAVKGAVSSPTPGDVIRDCFGAGLGSGAVQTFTPSATAATSAACTVIRRDPLTGSLAGRSVDHGGPVPAAFEPGLSEDQRYRFHRQLPS